MHHAVGAQNAELAGARVERDDGAVGPRHDVVDRHRDFVGDPEEGSAAVGARDQPAAGAVALELRPAERDQQCAVGVGGDAVGMQEVGLRQGVPGGIPIVDGCRKACAIRGQPRGRAQVQQVGQAAGRVVDRQRVVGGRAHPQALVVHGDVVHVPAPRVADPGEPLPAAIEAQHLRAVGDVHGVSVGGEPAAATDAAAGVRLPVQVLARRHRAGAFYAAFQVDDVQVPGRLARAAAAADRRHQVALAGALLPLPMHLPIY